MNRTDKYYYEISEFQPDLIILAIFLAVEDGNKIYVYWYFALHLNIWKIIKATVLMTSIKKLLKSHISGKNKVGIAQAIRPQQRRLKKIHESLQGV